MMMYTTYKSIYERTEARQMKDQAKLRAARLRAMRRLTVFFTVIIGVYFTFSSIVHAWTGDNDLVVSTDQQVQQVIVKHGDTLWGIAKTYIPVNHNEDIRDYIKIIMKHNDMKTSDLIAGDVIEVPLLATQ